MPTVLQLSSVTAGTLRHVPVEAPAVARGAWRARAAVAVAFASVSFLVAYAALQILHEADREPNIVAAVGGIPLYARCLVSATCAVVVGALRGLIARDPERLLRALPRILAAAIVLFTVAVVLFP